MHKRMMGIAAVFTAMAAMPALAEERDTAADVRATVEAFNAAYEENDVERYFDFYAPDAVVYFYGARQDVAAYEAEWTAMVAAGGAVTKNELSDVTVQVMPGGDAAVVTYFVDYEMRSADGETSASRAYESDVWQKIAGRWRIVNLHYSELPQAP